MTSLLLVFALRSSIPRDSYGVPLIRATSLREAWEDQGFAAAEDRMWQMEMSRHLARGTLASILGPSALASDTDVAKTGYTSAELQAQYNRLSPFAKTAMDGYAQGVTRFIQTHTLPPEFAAAADVPSPWSVLDSVAICVRLFQEFGRGGAGELRNLAFIQYAKTQPKLKDRYLDALDDFAWQNDPAAVTTLSAQDDVVAKNPPVIFPPFDRATTEARLKEIPIPNLFELLPAVQLAERADSHLLAQSLSTPFRTGSYCVVVSPRRSVSGCPLLLSGPQMGFTTPSILHEVSIDAPGLHIDGADVPGVPGVVVGKTNHFAWGVTSGEADTEDIVWSKTSHSGTSAKESTPRILLAEAERDPGAKIGPELSLRTPLPQRCAPVRGAALAGRGRVIAIFDRSREASLSLFLKRGREGWWFRTCKSPLSTVFLGREFVGLMAMRGRVGVKPNLKESVLGKPVGAASLDSRATTYLHDGKTAPFIERSVSIEIKGQAPKTVTSKWTAYGPVVLEDPSLGVVFSRHSAYRGQELRSFDALLSTYTKRTATTIDRAISPATMNFNYFYATTSGDIGYRYLGLVPLRAAGLDPRLPTPDEAQYAWKGFVPPSQMPHALNPKAGVIANWNNKPTPWWPNGDTPTWGRVHQANTLFSEVQKPKFSSDDLAKLVESIAQEDYTWPSFKEIAPPFDGRLVAGSFPATRYEHWFSELRSRLIEPLAGGFLGPEIFNLVAQPTVVWNALHGQSHLDFLAGRTPRDISSEALTATVGGPLPLYTPTQVTFKDLGTMPYRNRGTYIQIVELPKTGPQGRSVLPPGESATGPHAGDQLALANHWAYKPMH